MGWNAKELSTNSRQMRKIFSTPLRIDRM